MTFDNFLSFLEILKSSLIDFGSSIYNWVFTEIEIGKNSYTIFSLLLGGSVVVALGVILVKWLV